jgi:hypothetical protein
MSFPQPNSIDPVLAGQDFFRLLTQLTSAGDIYESEVSALAFAMGPDSDLSAVEINYFNPITNNVELATISPDRSLIGRLDARNDITYPVSKRKGRILISIEDLYDPEWRPNGFDDEEYEIIPPILDVIQYFTSPPSVVPPRSDRTFRFQYLKLPPNPTRRSIIAIPCYGRKSGYFTFRNADSVTDVPVTLGAVRFSTSEIVAGSGADGTAEELSLFTATLSQFASDSYVFKSSTDGLWDYFYISLGGNLLTPYNGTAFPITVTLSDDLA